MRRNHLILSALSAAILAACSPSTKTSTQADNSTVTEANNTSTKGWCFSGGPIYTADEKSSKIDALAIKGNVITYAGAVSPAWCETHAGKGAKHLDLAGKAMLPGLTDAHGHLLGIGLRELTLNLDKTTSIKHLQDQLAEALKTVPKGETLYGRGWIETHWPEGRFPNRADLDALSPDNPVILERADGHASVANSAALKAAGITGETKPPFGGDILKDEDGEPTGMLIDNAANLVAGLMPKLTEARKEQAFIKGGEVYASRGWTNVHSMSVDPANVAMMERLAKDGKLGIRVYNSLDIKGPEDVLKVASYDSEDGDLITTRAIKLYSDGALGSRGAALHEPYSDDPGNRGLMLIKKETIIPILEAAIKSGVQVNTHAIGDRANTKLLNWYEEALGDTGEAKRWRIEHAQILRLPDIARFHAMGVIPSMQPSHAIGDLHFAPARLGSIRLRGGYAWKSLIESGVIIAGGSDAPVEQGDPRIEFYAAIERKDLEGYSNANWYRDQRVSRDQALKMFTAWPAYAAFEEDSVGTLSVGRKADLVVFDTDFMTAEPHDILKANALLTMVDGKVVYKAE